MKPQRLDPTLIGGAATFAAVIAGITFVSLSGLAKPPGFEGRAARLAETLDRADKLRKSPGDGQAYKVATVCTGENGAAAEMLKRRVEAGAASASVSLTRFAVTPMSAGAEGSLAPVSLQFEAEGAYEALMLLLGVVAKSQPEVFADSIELKPKTATVTLKFKGRAFCWSPVPR